MKNILSSLNESEKKRILEMHYKASNRQYLTEKPATQKTTTSTQTYKQKLDSVIDQLYSDYFNFAWMEGSTEKEAIFQVNPKSNNTYYFEKVGDPNISALYYCKSGWGTSTGSNPFESNITLTYKSQTPSTNKGEKGLKISAAAQKLVNDACSKIGQPAATQKTTTTAAEQPKKLTKKEIGPNTGMYLYGDYDRDSKPGDEVLYVHNCSGIQGGGQSWQFYTMKTSDGNTYPVPACVQRKYSCKYKKWSTSEEPTVPTSQWVDDTTGAFGSMPLSINPKKPIEKGREWLQSDLGKNPRDIAQEIVTFECGNLKWE